MEINLIFFRIFSACNSPDWFLRGKSFALRRGNDVFGVQPHAGQEHFQLVDGGVLRSSRIT
jgi:hypothetical protein